MLGTIGNLIKEILDLFNIQAGEQDDLIKTIDHQDKIIELLTEKLKDLEDENRRLKGP